MMSESVIYIVCITLLIGLSGLGVWFARQSMGLTGMPLFTPKSRRIGLVEAALPGRRPRQPCSTSRSTGRSPRMSPNSTALLPQCSSPPSPTEPL
jgi:hypothetical protein